MSTPISPGIYFNSSQAYINSPTVSLKYVLMGFYKTAMAAATAYNKVKNPEMSITSLAPRLQGWLEKTAFEYGMNPSYPHIKELYLPAFPGYLQKIDVPFLGEISVPLPQFPVMTSHLITDSALAKQVLSYHRKDPAGPFNGASLSFDAALNLLGTVFKKKFDPNDFILTCGVEFTQIAHKQILEAIKLQNVKPVIDEVGQQFISRWIEKKDIELSSEVRLLASSLITQIVFKIKDLETCRRLSKSVEYMNGYLIDKALGLVTKADEKKFDEACLTFREITEEILELDLPIFKIKTKINSEGQFAEKELSTDQKKAICFLLYFAGQEATAFALTHAFAKLALDQEKQEALAKEAIFAVERETQGSETKEIRIGNIPGIKKFIHETLVEVPPALGVARKLRSDAYVVLETDEGLVKKYVREGERLTPMFCEIAAPLKNNPDAKAADALVFGFGKNHCIGQMLAMEELERFISLFLSGTSITTNETVFRFQPKTTQQALPFAVRIISREKRERLDLC